MADYRLKIKIGDHEFEAEGPADAVQAQFQMFKELVASTPAAPATPAPKPKDRQEDAEDIKNGNENGNGDGTGLDLTKIMKVDDRVVSMTVPAESVSDGVLLILFGQREFRANDSVTGFEVLQGLQMTGQPVDRVDKTLNRLATDGLVITIGIRRGRRYRLTNTGMTKAREIAKGLIATVP
jgi:hypothetical protein